MKAHQDQPTIVRALECGLWLATLQRVPTAQELRNKFGLSEDRARLWRQAAAKALNLPAPPLVPGRPKQSGAR